MTADTKYSLTEHEIEVLEMLAGKREWENGAWVNACLGFLRGSGYAAGMPYKITDKGRAFIEARGTP